MSTSGQKSGSSFSIQNEDEEEEISLGLLSLRSLRRIRNIIFRREIQSIGIVQKRYQLPSPISLSGASRFLITSSHIRTANLFCSVIINPMQQDKAPTEEESYFDSHTHLLDFPCQRIQDQLQIAIEKRVKFISTNTTHQKEYQKQRELVHKYSYKIAKIKDIEEAETMQGKVTIVPSFGIHPCYLHLEKDNPDWETTLETVVADSPFSGVGEIGLDFRTATLEINSKEVQTHFFIKQFEMALRLDRPVTVHCVRAYGDILKHFKHYHKQIEANANKVVYEKKATYDSTGTPIIMHSYGGSKQITKSLLKLTNLNIYFSLSLKRSEELCTVIPLQRLLLQTDAPFQPSLPLLYQQNIVSQDLSEQAKEELQQNNRVEFVRANVSSLCKYYQLERGPFARAVLGNALKVFRLIG